MTTWMTDSRHLLVSCVGFGAEADDGRVGVVETPLFPADRTLPDFLVLRSREGARVRTPVVPVTLVSAVDLDERVVRLSGRRTDILRMPEHLPLSR